LKVIINKGLREDIHLSMRLATTPYGICSGIVQMIEKECAQQIEEK
jgi:hypothetical protein